MDEPLDDDDDDDDDVDVEEWVSTVPCRRRPGRVVGDTSAPSIDVVERGSDVSLSLSLSLS